MILDLVMIERDRLQAIHDELEQIEDNLFPTEEYDKCGRETDIVKTYDTEVCNKLLRIINDLDDALEDDEG